jgi:hypothetical protein
LTLQRHVLHTVFHTLKKMMRELPPIRSQLQAIGEPSR